MNQDFFYKNLFFGGFYGVVFFLIYLFGRKAAPKLAIWLPVACWAGLMLIMLTLSGTNSFALLIPVMIILLFVFRKRIDEQFQPFFQENRIYKSNHIPESVLKLLGERNWSCAQGTLTLQTGESLNYYWWQGWTTSTVHTGKSTVTSSNHYLAVSFGPSDVTEEFKKLAKAAMDTSHFTFKQRFKRFFVLDTDTPYLATEAADGSFVIAWNTHQDIEHYTKRLHWLKQNVTFTPQRALWTTRYSN
ncbi:hypothetical protein [Runella sp.]|uniref:hypothetical protein n=1 Tax=Runella sp. TaxID=1960881 RepID=UPI003D135CCF